MWKFVICLLWCLVNPLNILSAISSLRLTATRHLRHPCEPPKCFFGKNFWFSLSTLVWKRSSKISLNYVSVSNIVCSIPFQYRPALIKTPYSLLPEVLGISKTCNGNLRADIHMCVCMYFCNEKLFLKPFALRRWRKIVDPSIGVISSTQQILAEIRPSTSQECERKICINSFILSSWLSFYVRIWATLRNLRKLRRKAQIFVRSMSIEISVYMAMLFFYHTLPNLSEKSAPSSFFFIIIICSDLTLEIFSHHLQSHPWISDGIGDLPVS